MARLIHRLERLEEENERLKRRTHQAWVASLTGLVLMASSAACLGYAVLRGVPQQFTRLNGGTVTAREFVLWEGEGSGFASLRFEDGPTLQADGSHRSMREPIFEMGGSDQQSNVRLGFGLGTHLLLSGQRSAASMMAGESSSSVGLDWWPSVDGTSKRELLLGHLPDSANKGAARTVLAFWDVLIARDSAGRVSEQRKDRVALSLDKLGAKLTLYDESGKPLLSKH